MVSAKTTFFPWSFQSCLPLSRAVAMDSESKSSLIGSFLQPPDKMFPAGFANVESKKLAAVGGDRPCTPNNQAVVAALKTLQEKIHRLELEKSQAEDNLSSLSIAAAQYKKTLEQESHRKDTAHQELMQQRKEISVQLNAAQSRCSLLEKQLDYMKKMVSSVELEKKIILEHQAQLQKEEDQNWLELRAKLEKLELLEKECLKLTATQRIAEDKIKHLEEKLCKEEHQHKLLQDKTAQLQTGFERSRILLSSAPSQKEPKKENGKKKKTKKKNPTMKKTHLSQLHVRAGELPFVAGKSVSSSHSVSANVQSVLHLMKHRSPRISSRSQGGATPGISGCNALSEPESSCAPSPAATRSLSDHLLALQDELGQMSFLPVLKGARLSLQYPLLGPVEASGSPLVCHSGAYLKVSMSSLCGSCCLSSISRDKQVFLKVLPKMLSLQLLLSVRPVP
ncbi:centrosomal protein CEP57L1 isoform X3 [Apus apus]|uniref:centrosomal protein CEP57L1 isoform X3 n=1 Tax=Apus apus TaxID=8895 RepID=UPI0021F89638|nr:centrosomal protein CEP57L1 isoform X3 [Apus apus]